MFGLEILAVHAAIYKARSEAEAKADERFAEMIKDLEPDERQRKIAERKQYKIDERRHQELCDAIRSSRQNITVRSSIF